jgi:hypothetical protein
VSRSPSPPLRRERERERDRERERRDGYERGYQTIEATRHVHAHADELRARLGGVEGTGRETTGNGCRERLPNPRIPSGHAGNGNGGLGRRRRRRSESFEQFEGGPGTKGVSVSPGARARATS